MTESERYNKYYKGLTVYSKDDRNPMILGKITRIWGSDDIRIIVHCEMHNTHYNMDLKLDDIMCIMDNINIHGWTISKLSLRKKKLELLKND